MTSKEEPAGIEASLTIKTSFDPSSLSIKILAVIPEVPVSYTHLTLPTILPV